jgi:hypothetical protein
MQVLSTLVLFQSLNPPPPTSSVVGVSYQYGGISILEFGRCQVFKVFTEIRMFAHRYQREMWFPQSG